MSRRDAYLAAMVRQLSAAYYRVLHGKGGAAEAARTVESVDAEETRGRGERSAAPRREFGGRTSAEAA
jgi:hypothetical protein